MSFVKGVLESMDSDDLTFDKNDKKLPEIDDKSLEELDATEESINIQGTPLGNILNSLWLGLTSTMEATSTEIEHEFFGYIESISEVEKLAFKKSVIIQPELRSANYDSPGAGSIRVRSYDNKKFILTIKSFAKKNGVNAAEETEYEVDKSVFDAFMKIAPASVQKTRYSIKDPSDPKLIWEVDIPLIEGVEFTGCKIDLEVPDTKTTVPPFPFKTRNMLDKSDNAGIHKLMQIFDVVNHNSIAPIKGPQ